jgi:hypothetical protein
VAGAAGEAAREAEAAARGDEEHRERAGAREYKGVSAGTNRGVKTLTTLPRTTLLIGISVVIVIAMMFANGVIAPDATQNRSTGGFIGGSLFGIALSAVLLLVAVPRLPDDVRPLAVLGFGIGAVIFCLFFWSAIPFALGVAAIAAAAPDDDSPEGDAPAPVTAGVLLAVLSILAAFVLCVIG